MKNQIFSRLASPPTLGIGSRRGALCRLTGLVVTVAAISSTVYSTPPETVRHQRHSYFPNTHDAWTSHWGVDFNAAPPPSDRRPESGGRKTNSLQSTGWQNATISLTRQTWQNPHPEKLVAHIEFISALKQAAPVLLGITVE